jgi:hypothetical protein
MKTNDIIEKAFSILEDMNQVEGFSPKGFRTFETKRRVGDFEIEVRGRVDNIYQGHDIHSRYIDMTFVIRIGSYATNGSLNGALGGEIKERTKVYQN